MQGVGNFFENTKQTGLSGEEPLSKAKTKAPKFDFQKNNSPVAARQVEVARDYPKRAARIDEHNGHLSGSDRPMFAALKRLCGGRVLVFVIDVFAEMPGDVGRIFGIIAHDLAGTHVPH